MEYLLLASLIFRPATNTLLDCDQPTANYLIDKKLVELEIANKFPVIESRSALKSDTARKKHFACITDVKTMNGDVFKMKFGFVVTDKKELDAVVIDVELQSIEFKGFHLHMPELF